jgi:lipoprotein signal peptidase
MSFSQKIFILMTFLVSIYLDQSTKSWSEVNLLKHSDLNNLTVYQGSRVDIFRYGNEFLTEVPLNASSPWVSVQLNYVRNFGAAWGFLSKVHDEIRLPFFHFLTLAFCSIFLWTAFAKRFQFPFLFRFGLILAVSGATGNFIDRLTKGYVVDFIDFKWQLFHWTARPPVFNVADVFVVLGLLMILTFGINAPSKS